MGSTPTAELSAYPSKQRLLTHAASVRRQVLASLGKMKAADLDKPAVKAPDFIATRGQAWALLITHETLHIGQLAVVRKELAKPAVIG